MDFPEPDYVEGKIYSGGFPSYRDKDLMQEFHACGSPLTGAILTFHAW